MKKRISFTLLLTMSALLISVISYGQIAGSRLVFSQEDMTIVNDDHYYTNHPELLREGMKYNELKRLYDDKLFEYAPGDEYNLNWLLNLVVPGLGQIVMNEPGRGVAFLAGSAGLYGAAIAVPTVLSANYSTASEEYIFSHMDEWVGLNESEQLDYIKANVPAYKQMVAGTWIGVGCLIAGAAIEILSIIDAIKVGKVKNLYYRDMKNIHSSVDVNINPYFSSTVTSGGLTPTAGLTMAINL